MIKHILAVGFLLSSLVTHAAESEIVVPPSDVSPIGLIVFVLILAAGLGWVGWLMWKAEKRAQEDGVQAEK